jgi:hypothetical protein
MRSALRSPARSLGPLALLLLLVLAPGVRADLITINFDTVPVLPLAPTTFANARQDLTIAGLGTVINGTPVSTPNNLASFGPGGGVRNAYGTRSGTSLGYVRDITFNFDPDLAFVTNVSGTLFNGEADLVSYTVTAFRGVTPLSSVGFTDVPDNTLSTGFRNWSLNNASGLGITRLVITPDTTFTGGSWNYFVDNVAVTFTPVGNAIPEPATIVSLGLGGLLLAGVARRRRAAR